MSARSKLVGPTRSRRWLVAVGLTTAVVSAGLVGFSPAPAVSTFGYTGKAAELSVPEGTDELVVTARGGGGGAGTWPAEGTVGAEVSGVVPVQPGDRIMIEVGGTGQAWRDSGEAKGGWGGTGAKGGDGGQDNVTGNSAAGGGGATVVWLVRDGRETTVLVAGGGGGDGAPSMSRAPGGTGGHGGDGSTGLAASGGDGGDGANNPDSGGKAGAMSGVAGQGGQDTSMDRAAGGGAGGGVNGGAMGLAGKTSNVNMAGGGGGAGSSMIDASVHAPRIQPADQEFRAKNGEFTYSFT